MQKFIVFAGMGVEIGAMIYVAFMLGGYLDGIYHTKGLIFLALALIFLAAWLTQIIWLTRRFQEQEDKDSPP